MSVSPSLPATPSTTPPASTPTPTLTTPTSSTGGGTGGAPTTTNTPPSYPTPTTTTPGTPAPGLTTSTSTSTIHSSSVLTESSTRVYETSSIITSDGQVYTTQIQVTTILNPGTVVNSSSTATHSNSSSSNTGAIVGGVIGGTAVLVLLGLLAYFLFNKKRRLKDEFDGNFDPLAVAHSKHSPHPSQGGGGAAAAANPAGRPGNGTLPHPPEEDDGMGGRLARGADGGGIINPYPFASPPTQPSHPQMTQYGQGGGGGGLHSGAMMALGAGAATAAYNNESPQQQTHRRNPSNISSVSSGNYPGSNNGPAANPYLGVYNNHPGGGGSGYQGQSGQYLGQSYAQGQGQQHHQVSPTNTTSSGDGSGLAYNNPYAPPIGRGPSPGPSMGMSDNISQSQYTSSSGAGGGGSGGAGGLVGGSRMAKEIEAFGGNGMSLAAVGGGMMTGMPLSHVANPDDGPPQMHEPQGHQQQGPGYFGAQPTTTTTAGAHQNYYNPSTISGGPPGVSPSATPTAATTVQPSMSSKPGLITLAPSPSISSRPLVQHQDGGRVEENPEAPSEIPPAYDSLPQEIRR